MVECSEMCRNTLLSAEDAAYNQVISKEGTMRFLFFAAQYLPTVGGVERYTHNLAKTLVSGGHSVVVITSALPGLPPFEVEDGIDVFRLPAWLFLNGRFPIIKRNGAFRRMTKEIFQKGFDLAIINTRFYSLSLFAANECKRQKVPAVVTEHGTKHLSLDNPVLDFFGNFYEHLAMRRIRRSCDRFYGVSLACCDWLKHFSVDAEGTLYNAVDPDMVEQTARSGNYTPRVALNIPESADMIVFIGRFIREKGIVELLDGFALARKQYPDSFLVMAGDGPLFEEIEKKKSDGVVLSGMLPYEDCISLLCDADIFVLPSYSEGFSTVILEAAALGTPVITTKTGGSPELIVSGKSGILLNEITAESICEALVNMLDNSDFYKKEAMRSKLTPESIFTFSKTADRLTEIAAAEKENI